MYWNEKEKNKYLRNEYILRKKNTHSSKIFVVVIVVVKLN